MSKKKGVDRAAIARTPPGGKRAAAVFGGKIANSAAFDFVMSMINFHVFFAELQPYTARREITVIDGKVIATLHPEGIPGSQPQRYELDLARLAERVYSDDANFFELVAKLLRWMREGGKIVDYSAWCVLMAVEGLAIRSDGKSRITSKQIIDALDREYPLPDGGSRDEGNVRKLLRELGITVPIAAEDQRAFILE
jgi:hypothetical protein